MKQYIDKANKHPVNQYDLQGNYICTWESANEAAKVSEGEYNASSIRACCIGKQGVHAGYMWGYANVLLSKGIRNN